MKKLTRRELIRRLEEYLDKKDAKKVGDSIPIYSQLGFDEAIDCFESEEKDGFGDLTYDVNIESIIESLFYNGLTADDVINNFLNFYSIGKIAASESGEGLMFMQA